MLLSEMFGVERDTDFGVKGYSVTFKIVTLLGKYEYLMYRWSDRLDWREAEVTMLCNIIAGAPGNIIHLPPPLTDNQIEHLKALWAIGGQWLAKDASGTIFCYKAKPQKKDGCEWTTWESDEFIDITDFVTSVSGLVSWLDHEPYDIAKALEIKR